MMCFIFATRQSHDRKSQMCVWCKYFNFSVEIESPKIGFGPCDLGQARLEGWQMPEKKREKHLDSGSGTSPRRTFSRKTCHTDH